MSRSFEIWMFKWPGLIWSFPMYRDETKAAVCLRHPWQNLRRLAGFKARGDYTLDTYRRHIRSKPMPLHRRVLAWAIAAFPNRLYNRLILCYLRASGAEALQIFEVEQSRFGAKRQQKVNGGIGA
jgi:hypothetical protein